MSFGGAVSAMITSMKNNKRKRSSAYEKMEKFNENYNTQLYFDKKATPEQLQKIRERIKKEQRKSLILTSIILIIIIVFFTYLVW